MAQENLKPELYIVRPVLWSKSVSSVVRSSIDCNDLVVDARSAFDYFSARSTRVFGSVTFLPLGAEIGLGGNWSKLLEFFDDKNGTWLLRRLCGIFKQKARASLLSLAIWEGKWAPFFTECLYRRRFVLFRV